MVSYKYRTLEFTYTFMASINFLYRSVKENAPLNVRLLFRHEDRDYVLGGRTKLYVSRNYWNNVHGKKRIKDVELKNLQVEIQNELMRIENYLLDAFHKASKSDVDKQWLSSQLDHYYHPKSVQETPLDLVSYIDYYLEYRKDEISEANRKKVRVVQNKMLRLQEYLGKKILIENINESFKKAFVDFSAKHSYSQNTQHREFVLIKTICFHASYLGLKTHHQLQGLHLKREETDHVFLDFEELTRIREAKLSHEYLENARDWLVISCYTGQRISDFMRFSPEMIRIEDGKTLLEFRQKKTKKDMSIPMAKEVKLILEKRGGFFPRPISDQRYNDYIKEVCREAGINEVVQGKKRVSIAPKGEKPSKYDYRDVFGTFQKWELVSSHIGRRSFATNFYGKVPTTYLINITGHGSEKMFLSYIKKSNKDLALDAFNYFN